MQSSHPPLAIRLSANRFRITSHNSASTGLRRATRFNLFVLFIAVSGSPGAAPPTAIPLFPFGIYRYIPLIGSNERWMTRLMI